MSAFDPNRPIREAGIGRLYFQCYFDPEAAFLHCYQMTVVIFAVAMRDTWTQLYRRLSHQGGDNGILSRASYPVFVRSCLDGGRPRAQSIPPEGPLAVTYTATQTQPTKPMSIGGRREFVVLNLAMTASNDAGNPVLNNMGGRCQLTRLTDSSVNNVEVHGFCTYADNEGDQIFEQCDFLPGAPNNCKLTGGTGKFEGLEASIVITPMPLKGNYDNITQSIGHKKGTYKIVKTH
jgi:hypothetical protein